MVRSDIFLPENNGAYVGTGSFMLSFYRNKFFTGAVLIEYFSPDFTGDPVFQHGFTCRNKADSILGWVNRNRKCYFHTL